MNDNSFDDEFITELNSYLESLYILGYKKYFNDLKNSLVKLNKSNGTELDKIIDQIEEAIRSNSMDGLIERLVGYVNDENNSNSEASKKDNN